MWGVCEYDMHDIDCHLHLSIRLKSAISVPDSIPDDGIFADSINCFSGNSRLPLDW